MGDYCLAAWVRLIKKTRSIEYPLGSEGDSRRSGGHGWTVTQCAELGESAVEVIQVMIEVKY